MGRWTLKLLLVWLLLPSTSFIRILYIFYSVCIMYVRPSVETHLPRFRRSFLSGNSAKKWAKKWSDLSSATIARSFGRIPPWEKLEGARPRIRWIQSSSSPGLQSRAGQVQHNSGDYAIIFKSFYYVVCLDCTYVLCIVSKNCWSSCERGIFDRHTYRERKMRAISKINVRFSAAGANFEYISKHELKIRN